ncbi:MAG TPA: UDP-N-acetylmuramate dehydrogenase [Bacteroidales bacterium]|nr:UDP-N-acetylmuramate dehydrogenase [Bacteroidales bacterium]
MYALNKDLKTFNTFGISCMARSFFQFSEEEELISYIRTGKTGQSDTLILGGGSNILFTRDFQGLVIHPANTGIRVEHLTNEYVIANVGAGVIWDDFVSWAVDRGLGGVENLSYIPGLAGASPVQNIGAYGTEAEDTVISVRCIMLSDGETAELTAGECNFSYRNSIFKNDLKGKAVVTAVRFRLSRNPVLNLAYPDVANECELLGGASLDNVRKAVINIRRRKLPDPLETGNAGSFFKNPVITADKFGEILKEYPELPGHHRSDGGVKIPAGWLIEKCGWKGKTVGEAGVHPNQALVLVNIGRAKGSEIADLAREIKKSVLERFGVELEPEVEII